MVLVALLDEESDTALLSRNNADGLVPVISILLFLRYRRVSRVQSWRM